jgi:hypothetical protein
MPAKITALSKERHATKKLKRATSYEFSRSFHLCKLGVQEFGQASASFPIVFIEQKDSENFIPVALMGLSNDENLFVSDTGSWDAEYIPALIRRFPFFSTKIPDKEDEFLISLDEGSELINDSEGEPLFDNEGNPTTLIDNIKRFLLEIHRFDTITDQFSGLLRECNLLTPFNIKAKIGESGMNINGIYALNEERLKTISDKRFLELRDKQFLGPIYAHLVSLGRFERLIERKNLLNNKLTDAKPVESQKKKKQTRPTSEAQAK